MIDFGPLVAAVAEAGQGLAQAAFLVFLRVGAAMALLPAFGEQSVPVRVRLVLTLVFTAILLPAVAGTMPPGGLPGPAAILIEVAVGLSLGIALRLFVHALTIGGAITAQATSLSQLFGGTGMEPQPVVAHLLTTAGLALAVVAGLHIRIAELFLMSYDLFPPGAPLTAAAFSDWGLHQIGQAFRLGFALSAPFVIASLVYNVALGVINRAMPQLMVAFVGAPALTLGGMMLVAVVAPIALALWLSALNGFLADPFTVTP